MHTLICGVTESGKTTLAHALAGKLADSGARIIVYDPVGTKTSAGNWPESAILFDDETALFDYLSRDDVHSAHVFVDEAGEIFNLGKRENFWLLTRGRHFGFHVILIAQRPKMLPPTVRTQCARGYLFRMSPDDAAEILGDFGHRPKILGAPLDKGDFYILDSGQASIKRANIFNLLKKGA
jgi:DNA helicase HerA-like ATPase